jgi:multidrug efflux system membrane fusion protein
VAPATGRVGMRQVDQGNYVTPGDTNGIVVINQLQPISVIFNIPEDNVGGADENGASRAAADESRGLRSRQQRQAGRRQAAHVDNEIDTTTGTVKLRAQFDNADGALFPNQFVNVQLLQELLKNQLIMPNAAVRRGAPNGVVSTFVYLVNADRTVACVP